jgi:hypothetical protein
LNVVNPCEELRVGSGLVGGLVVTDWVEGNSERRPLKKADLMDLARFSIHYPPRLLTPPLFDAVLL